jgi:hypothetical protein
MGESLKELCDRLRAELLGIETQVRAIKGGEDVKKSHDVGEAIAQSMLAVRHIEDARMRLGKVLQHWRDGVSAFDQPSVQAAINAIPPTNP